MSIPDRSASASLLLSLDPPPWHLRHSRAVAEVAAWLGLAAARNGVAIDRRLVESAALLHDVDKLAAVKPAVAEMPHGQGSAAWLARRGLTELGPAVAAHPVTRLAEDGWFDGWIKAASDEELVVAYADKRAGQRLESMADRFASWERRYPVADARSDDRSDAPREGAWTRATLDAVRARAGLLERRVCALAAVSPQDVRRLAWTSVELARARKAAAQGAGSRGRVGPDAGAGDAGAGDAGGRGAGPRDAGGRNATARDGAAEAATR